MQREVLLGALAVVFGTMTAVLLLLSPIVSWGLLFVALPMGLVAGLMWYHASGRLTERMRRRAARRRGRRSARTAGTGPRGRRAGPRAERSRGRRRARQRAAAGGPAQAEADAGMSRKRALSVLGLGGDADQDAIRRAYRQRVKEVHPDRGGDEDEFKRVREAYERLSD